MPIDKDKFIRDVLHGLQYGALSFDSAETSVITSVLSRALDEIEGEVDEDFRKAALAGLEKLQISVQDEFHNLRMRMLEAPPMPWDAPELRDWSIVGLHHSYKSVHGQSHRKERFLFVALENNEGVCIQAEGPDAAKVWETLRRRALKARE